VLRVDQPLWTWGRITAGIDAAGYREGAAGWAVAEARRDIALRVINAWSEVQRQQLRRISAEEGLKAHDDLLALMRRRVEQDVSPKVDEDFARSRLLLARNDLASVQQGLNAALSQLSLLAGTRIARADGRLDEGQTPDSAEAALEQAISRSPTLKRLEEESLAAGEDVRSRRASALPQVSFRLEHYMGTRPGGLPEDSRALVVISAQPGAGLSYRSGVDAAMARQQTTLQARDVAYRDLSQQIQADWEELSASRVRLANATEAANMAGQVFDSYMRQFTAGRKTWIDVLNAIREVTQTAFGIADARAQTAAAAQRLRLLSGRIDLESLTHAP
jgi:adhesin transport system outer membrane protein